MHVSQCTLYFEEKNIVYLHPAIVRTWYVSYTILIRTLSVTFGLKITNSQDIVDLIRDGLIKKKESVQKTFNPRSLPLK